MSIQYPKPAVRSSRHTDESYAAYLRRVEVMNAALRAEEAERTARRTAAAIETLAAARARPKKPRQHANGTLDERALRRAKEWQR